MARGFPRPVSHELTPRTYVGAVAAFEQRKRSEGRKKENYAESRAKTRKVGLEEKKCYVHGPSLTLQQTIM